MLTCVTLEWYRSVRIVTGKVVTFNWLYSTLLLHLQYLRHWIFVFTIHHRQGDSLEAVSNTRYDKRLHTHHTRSAFPEILCHHTSYMHTPCTSCWVYLYRIHNQVYLLLENIQICVTYLCRNNTNQNIFSISLHCNIHSTLPFCLFYEIKYVEYTYNFHLFNQ